jgi:hypothetical protein
MEAAPVDSSPLTTDWPCAVCDYNLRGLSSAALCPECGSPVQQSLDFRYLGNSNPRWVRTIRHGTTAAAVVTTFTVSFTIFVLFAPLLSRGGGTRTWMLIHWPSAPFTLANFAAMWAVARPEPGGVDPREKRSARLLLATLCISTLLNLAPPALFLTYSAFGLTIRVVALSFTAMALYFLFYRHLRRIAARIPSGRLKTAFTLLGWMHPSAILLSNLLPRVLPFAGLRQLYTMAGIEMALFAPSVIIRVWSAFELWRLRSALLKIVPVSAESA